MQQLKTELNVMRAEEKEYREENLSLRNETENLKKKRWNSRSKMKRRIWS